PMPVADAWQGPASNSEGGLSKMLQDQRSATILYRATPDAETHEFPVLLVQQWYEQPAILLSARFSLDKGTTWESIIELRRRNGTGYPFIPKSDEEEEVPPGFGSIAAARKLVDAHRAEVERLEEERDEMEREVEEQERMLEKMREMEKQLEQLKIPDREKYAQVEARMFQVTARLERESRSAEKKPQPDDIVLQAGIESGPEKDENAHTQQEREGSPETGLLEAQSGTEPEPEPEPEPVVRAPSASGTSRISVPRPRLFPMLQPSTLQNDYAATASVFSQMRSLLQKGIPAAATAATAATFDPPPTCSLCYMFASTSPLCDLFSFLEHVLSETHLAKIAATGGKISVTQCFYWLEILQKGYTTRPMV
ncbi:hypothetical protein PENTCL1PPCAC_8065, partial [Pristionchus entomophagus]